MGDSLIIKIGANAKSFDQELKKLKNKTKELEKGLATTAKISAAAFTGLAVAVGGAVSRFSQFEKTFTNVQTLLDKSSFSTKTLSKGISDLRNDVLKLGAASGESFEGLNQGLFDLVSAGVPAEEATQALADAVDLATAGATETSVAVKALTSAITAYGSEAGSTSDIAEKFFTAQKFGVTTVGELATEFNKVGGLAKQLGLNFDEALAAATSLTANGAKPTAQAFTEFRAVLNAVILAQGKLKDQSVEVASALSLQNVEQKGIVGALTDLKVATGGNVVEMQKLLGSSEALSAALSLTGAQAGVFDKILGEMNDETRRATNFQDALAVKQQTTERSIARLSRSVESIVIQLGERFAPTINKIADGLSNMAKSFNELTDEQKDSIANFIKMGAAITAAITAVSTFGLAAIKLGGLLKTVATVLKVGRLAALGFTGALTGGLSIALAFLPEILQYLGKIFKVLTRDPEGIDALNDKLDQTIAKRKTLEALANDENKRRLSGISKEQAEQRLLEIDKEIAKLEELKQKKLEAEQPVQSGAVKAGEVQGVSTDNSQIQEVQRIEDEKQRIEREAAERKKQEKLEREQEELEEAREKAEKDAEMLQERLANEADIEREWRELTKEEKDAFDNQQIEDLNNLIITEQEAKSQQVVEDVKREAARRTQYLKDEAKFGAQKAKALQAERKFQDLLNRDEVKGAIDVSTQLIQLQNSKNKTLKAIGKRAAQARIAVETAQGAIAAYSSLSGIPIVGPALGAAAAAALVAYGAERAANVRSAQRGGFVPNAIGGSRDRVPMLLEPNELVVPKALAPDFIQSVGRPDTQADNSPQDSGAYVVVGIEDDAADFLTAKQRENRDLAIGVA